MEIPHELEVAAGGKYDRLVDVLIPPGPGHNHLPVALEVDGSIHFARNRPDFILGGTALRNRMLARAGLQVASVHVRKWDENRTMAERSKYLLSVLEGTGVKPTVPDTVWKIQ